MKRASVAIIEEFLRSDDRAIRRNAVAALAALPDDGALDLLKGLADTDRDAEVRRDALCSLLSLNPHAGLERLLALASGGNESDRAWAQDELLGASPELVARVADEIVGTLEREPANADAYMLLGRLGARQGIDVRLPRLGWRKRIQRASALRAFDARTGRRAEGARVRDMGELAFAAVRGAFIAAVVVVAALALGQVGTPVLMQALAPLGAAVLIAPLLTTACRYAYPVNLQADKAAAQALEAINVVRGAVLPLPVALALPLLLTWFTLRQDFSVGALPHAALVVAAGFVITLLTLAGVRAGTLAAFGLSPARLYHGTAQAIGGAIVGGTVATASSAIAMELSGTPELAFQHLWLVLIAAGAGVAFAFATVDEVALPVAPASATVWPRLLVLLGGPLVASYVVLAPPSSPVDATRPFRFPFVVERDSVPVTIGFTVQGPVRAAVVLSDHSVEPVADLVVTVRRGADTIATADDPPRIDTAALVAGAYEVLVNRFGADEGEERAPTLASVLRQRLVGRGEPVGRGGASEAVSRYKVVVAPAESLTRAQALVASGEQLMRQGRAGEGLEELRRAETMMQVGIVEPTVWAMACWNGARAGLAGLILTACDRALAVDASRARLDARGIARALAGESAGAADDLDAAAALLGRDGPAARARSDWARQLRAGVAGRAIFTPRLLDSLAGLRGFPW